MVDTKSLSQIDSFPYRHRVSEVMTGPVVTVAPEVTVVEASRTMAQGGISSLVVVDAEARPQGIVTERDVLRTVASDKEGALRQPLSAIMSSPVATVRHDAFVYVAMGRMDRMKLRHLVAVDERGRTVGMVTVRGLLRLRSGTALAFGDEIAHARSGEEMVAVKSRVPSLAGDLLAEGVDGLGVAAVTSSVLRDMTMRAAQLAEESMAAEAWGPAPAPWCVLLLGSGGRRESLFGADQDNAVIHAGSPADDHWYAEAGRRMCDTLDAAGVPYCKGGVMAQNQEWRHTSDGWLAEIDRWVKEADGKELLNIHIFVDFRPVYGDVVLADAVRRHLVRQAAGSSRFLHAMAGAVSEMHTPLGVLGQFKTKEGRLDIKLSGLMPLASVARLLALKHRIAATGTVERLAALADAEHMARREAEALIEAHELMLRILLRQQIADLDQRIPLSNRIDPKLLKADERDHLKQAFKAIGSLGWVMRNALSTV